MKTKHIIPILITLVFTCYQLEAQTRTLDTSLPVGTTPGAAGVSESGAATYSIPIFVSPGTSGMQPNLSVTYNSQAADGLLGKGWSLNGISVITRIPAIRYFDGFNDPVNFNDSDRFALDGQRLIATNGSYGVNDTEYHTEIESFVKVISYGAAGNGPAWFKGETKNGMIMEFGNTPDSRTEAQGRTDVLMWFINKITDPIGNYMTFSYIANSDSSVVYISKIEYTGNINTSLTPYNSINFFYQNRNINQISYVSGSKIINSKVLNKITIVNESTLVREYNFNYNSSGETKLTEIIEKDKNGIQFNSTLIDWGASTPAFTETSSFTNIQDTLIFCGDFNGDGRTDLFVMENKPVYTTSDLWKLYTTNEDGISFIMRSSGYLPDKFQPDLTRVGDVDGNGMEDIILCNKPSTMWYHTPYLSNGNGFTIMSSDKISNYYEHDFQISDFDGDGISDMIVINKTATSSGYEWRLYSYVYTDDGGNLVSYFGSPKDYGYISNSFDNYPLISDFNGNGKTELLYLSDIDSIKIFEYSDSDFKLVYKKSQFFHQRCFVGDFNGDGNTDLIDYTFRWGHWNLYFSDGNKFLNPIDVEFDGCGEAWLDYFRVKDFNGDGKDDLWFYCNDGNIYYSDGNGSFIQNCLDIYFYSYKINFNFGDFNGDGKQDIFFMRSKANSYTTVFTHKNETSHLVSSITNGLNHVTRFNYKTLSSGGTTYTKTAGSKFPVFDFQGPLYVVDNIVMDNGIGSANTTYYQYAGAKIHRRGKGFLGFSTIISYSNVTGLRQENTYAFDNAYYHTYLKQSHNSTTSPYNPSISTTNHWVGFYHYGDARYFPYDSVSTSYNILTGTTTTATSVYNNSGNLISSYVNSNGLTTKTTVYSGYNSMGQPGGITTTSTRTNETNYVTKDSFQYYPTGLLKLQITEPGNAKQVNTSYTYNTFGNVTQVTTTSANVGRREVYYEYDTKGRMRTKTRNTEGHFTKDSCNFALGIVLQSTDHNNLVTTYGYDGFGRLTQSTSPDGITSTVTHNWAVGTVPHSYYSVNTAIPGAPVSIKYYDKLGREVGTETVQLNGWKAKTITRYNEKGQLSFAAIPDHDTTHYTYDFLGRAKTVIGPNTNVTYNYTGLITSVTDNLRQLTSTSEADATGLTKKNTDASGNTIEYTYNAQGQARQVATLGNYITMGYDQFGRQTLLRDQNAGSHTYNYNNYGELTGQTDTLNRTTSVAYDSLGRVTAKTLPDYSFTYYYSAGGVTDSIKSANVTTLYTYDTYKRLKSKTDRVKGSPLKTEYEYDTYGRISKRTFPSGLAVTYHYKNGHLEEIKRADNGAGIWKVNYTTERGQVSYCTYGNGVYTNYQYNANGALAHIVTNLGAIQNLEYYYNSAGLLVERNDYGQGRNLNETFTYDNDNRLDSIKLNGTLTNNMVYKNNGAISYKTDVGNYTYTGETSQNVKKVECNGFIRPQPQTITYTSFGKTATITEGSKTCSFIYGTDMERSYMEANIFGTITKKYYTDSYEKTITGSTTRELNYIFAYGQLVAIFVKNGGTDTMYYVHTDHLGSLNVITDQSGAIVNEMSFDAWGNRRDPVTWQNYKKAPAGLITSRGFTGHEHMDAFGLINMNGRVYDPVLATFLSPDNYVQAPGYTQSYNRYSYCFNNPLIFTDPTGYRTWWDNFKRWVKNGFDNLGDWMTKNNYSFQVGYSMSMNTWFGGTPYISGTTGRGHNISVGYNVSTNQVGVATNNTSGFTDFYYPGYNYNAAVENVYRQIDEAREYRQIVNESPYYNWKINAIIYQAANRSNNALPTEPGEDNIPSGPKYFTENGELLFNSNEINLENELRVVSNKNLAAFKQSLSISDWADRMNSLTFYSDKWNLRTNNNGQTFMVKPKDLEYWTIGIIDCAISSWNKVKKQQAIPTKIPSTYYTQYIYGIPVSW